MINIKKCSLDFVREKLTKPFGFKGGYLSELWQPVVKIESDSFTAVCPSVQSVLWSDAHVFSSYPEASGNAMMFTLTSAACRMIEGLSFDTPSELTLYIAERLRSYADKVCGFPVSPTFVLNSLVGIDFALWMLYAKENNIRDFAGIVPPEYESDFRFRHEKLAHIPLVSYAVNDEALDGLLNSGVGLLKIKIGKHVSGDEGGEEDMAEMLKWDISRLQAIHEAAKKHSTPLTKDGHVRYYLDANGRYDTKARLEALLDAAKQCGALPYIELIEEPFAEDSEIFVGDLPVNVAADESAHSLADLKRRIAQGYRVATLKPAAKTLSLTFAMTHEAYSSGCSCLTADLTVNPLLAMWNRVFATCIAPLPGMNAGCVEVNGDSNYIRWEQLKKLLPDGLVWQQQENGAFTADSGFINNSGKLFESNGYKAIFER